MPVTPTVPTHHRRSKYIRAASVNVIDPLPQPLGPEDSPTFASVITDTLTGTVWGNQVLVENPADGHDPGNDANLSLIVKGASGGSGANFRYYASATGCAVVATPAADAPQQVLFSSMTGGLTGFGTWGQYDGSQWIDGDVCFFTSAQGGGDIIHERLRIKGDSGNIGIGTDAPAHALEVVGDIKAQGNFIAADDSTGKTVILNFNATSGKCSQLVFKGGILIGYTIAA